jgi:hypothetical protein
MHVGCAGHDRLGAPDDDAVRTALLDVHVDVRIDLLAGSLRAVALRIRHRYAERKVAVLNVVEIAEKALAVVGAVTIIGQLGRLEEAVQRVVRQVALRAARRPADRTYCLQLVEQVGRILVDVQHAVDGLARRALSRRHDRHVFPPVSEVVGHADTGHAGVEERFVRHALDGVAVHEHPRLVGAQRIAIVGGCHQHDFSIPAVRLFERR